MKTRQVVWRDLGVVALAAAGVAAYMLAAGLAGEAGFPLDDAWIHQTYARNLAQSGQWLFVPGEPSAGSTAPLYTLLLSVGYLLRLPYMLWTFLLGAAALAAGGLIAIRLADRLLPDTRGAGGWAGLATVLAWHLIWAGASGMETMLFATLTLALVWLGWRELDSPGGSEPVVLGRGVTFGLVGAAATLTRPEGAGLVALIGLLMWIARPGSGWRWLFTWSAGAVLGWLAGFVPYAMLNMSLGGELLPNTASAKQAENAILLAASYPSRIMNLLLPILAGGQLLLLPGWVAAVALVARRAMKARRDWLLLAPALWAVALVGLYAARLPAPYQHGRYVIPALPHLVVVGVAGTAWLWRRGRGSLAGRVGARALALTAGVLFVLFWGIGLQQYVRDVQIIQTEMVAAARWLDGHLPPEELLAVHDIGAVGYYAPRPILDLAGLVSPEVIPIIRDSDALWALMEARNVRYLMALPDQIPGQNPADPRLCPVYSTGGTWSPAAGGENMVVYALAWDGQCPAEAAGG